MTMVIWEKCPECDKDEQLEVIMDDTKTVIFDVINHCECEKDDGYNDMRWALPNR